jgi:hypothetical protein
MKAGWATGAAVPGGPGDLAGTVFRQDPQLMATGELGVLGHEELGYTNHGP